MSRMTLGAYLRDDGVAILEMIEEETLLAHMTLEASDLERMIAQLADLRATMEEVVPEVLDPGSRLPAVRSPSWQTSVALDQVVLALRHPGIGWIGSLLERGEALALSEALAREASKLPPRNT